MNLKKLNIGLNLPKFYQQKPTRQFRQAGKAPPNSQHINPRFRAYGKARLDIANRVQTQEDWDTLWKEPVNPFILNFPWGSVWKQCVEYYVTDFAAEIGFWIDIIGLHVVALGPDYAQFISPGGEISFAISPASQEQSETPKNALRLQFMIDEITETVKVLEGRSVAFEQPPQALAADMDIFTATFRTPHGISVELWGQYPDPAKQKYQSPVEPVMNFNEEVDEDQDDDDYASAFSVETWNKTDQAGNHDVLLSNLSFLSKPGNKQWEDLNDDQDDDLSAEDDGEPMTLEDLGLAPTRFNNYSATRDIPSGQSLIQDQPPATAGYFNDNTEVTDEDDDLDEDEDDPDDEFEEEGEDEFSDDDEENDEFDEINGYKLRYETIDNDDEDDFLETKPRPKYLN